MAIFETTKSIIAPTTTSKNSDISGQTQKPSVLAKLQAYKAQAENEKLCLRTLGEYLQNIKKEDK